MKPALRRIHLGALFALILVATVVVPAQQIPPWPREAERPDAPKPKPAPAKWLSWIGEYGTETEPVYVLERNGHLAIIFGRDEPLTLNEVSTTAFRVIAGAHRDELIRFQRGANDRGVSVRFKNATYNRRQVGPENGSGQLHIQPVSPVADVLREAIMAEPPRETGKFRTSELVELTKLDSSIKLEIRYATTHNFLGAVFYSQARAFLQRPAAEAVVRAHRKLRQSGYGILVHDGYRPWFVTKAFWDATPADKKWLVADPANGSRHNRGCAADVTLFDLRTGRPVEMPSTYDESTTRAYAFYPGGTDLQRWHRALLRRVMEAEGFTVNPEEWWHFDYKDWRSYRIGNMRFEEIT
jgi:D-alanyl-D-alanine dipeptidase